MTTVWRNLCRRLQTATWFWHASFVRNSQVARFESANGCRIRPILLSLFGNALGSLVPPLPQIGFGTSCVDHMNAMEALARRYSTQSVNGQRLRLYTTCMAHPENARVGLLGFNQATSFPADTVSPDQYVAAMLDGQLNRALYERTRQSWSKSDTTEHRPSERTTRWQCPRIQRCLLRNVDE